MIVTRRNAARLAWFLCAITIGLLGATLVLALLIRNSDLPAEFTEWEGLVLEVVGTLGAPILGAVIASRRPDNAYGWLWCGIGLSACQNRPASIHGPVPKRMSKA